MPNHVRNIVKFKNLKSEEDIKFILDMVASPLERPMIGRHKDYAIDFDKIIPEPRTIEDCDLECVFDEEKIKSGHTGVECTDDRVWFDWYTWHNKYWGTKWNAYDCYTKIGKSYITFIFSTAWNFPEPIIARLTLLGYDIDFKYADENLGNNCGKFEFTSKHGWAKYSSEEIKNSYKFAERIWSSY